MRQKADNSFLQFVLEQLAPVGEVYARAMFGGHGLYREHLMFGIVHAGRFYLKTSSKTQVQYRDRGMKPFEPRPGTILKSYYEVPIDVLEDSEQLKNWADEAIAYQVSRHGVNLWVR